MDVNQYMGMFMEESREHLQALNKSLLDLENDAGNISVLGEIFRSAHTLKGMSATMGFTVIAELTHEMENVLDLLRKETLKCDENIIDLLFRCVDTLERLVESAGNGEKGEDVSALVQELKKITPKGGAAPAKTAAAAKPDAPAPDMETVAIELSDIDKDIIAAAQGQGLAGLHIKIALDEKCMLKAARVYMVMTSLEDFGEVIKTVPSAEDLEKERFGLSFDVVLLSGKDIDGMKDRLLGISEIVSVEINKLPDFAAGALTEDAARKASSPTAGAAEKHDAPAAKKAEDHKVKSVQSVRVDIDKLDTLLNIVGEIVINKTRLAQIGIMHRLPDLVETIEQMDRVTTELQTIVMKIRMVPISQVFNRFPRMVRDISRELNKEINLIIEGEETELDRTVIDEIGDPLMHILRNSLDHGIESAEERRAAGKKPTGNVKLIASHEGNNVVIDIEDDGKGIDPAFIKRKAVEKGVITQQESDKMDDNEAIKIIFAPGFSTASVVTDISGRGVGMDVVRTKIEALGGNVDVETKLGAGSKFKIRLPLTLAIIQALLIKVADETYAIPLGSIDSTINIVPTDISTVQNKEVFLLRGQIIPIIRLNRTLNVSAEEAKPAAEELYIVIVHMGEQKAGIIVDTLVGQHDIVIKSLGKLMTNISVIAGATVLGDGSVALILDIATVMQTS
ncbi:MAG: chemotaxis protein CheA [Acidaminococcales bacterium]|jgi:two-component system chemotaxis sensor kinase CheA|nr:chemotaxis protein CheA [Acidaminococcales bacterium]